MISLNEIINEAFLRYRKYFKYILLQYLLNAIAAVILLAMFIAIWTLMHIAAAPGGIFLVFYVFCFLFLCAVTITDAAFIALIHHKEKIMSMNIDDAYGWALRHFFPVLVINSIFIIIAILTEALIFPLNILIIIPAIMVSQAYYFVLLENENLFDALKNGIATTKGRRLKLFVLWIGVYSYSPFILRYSLWRSLTAEKNL